MKKLLWVLLLPFSAFAAEDFTLWDSATFTGPFTNGIVATSAEISNNSDLNSLRIDLDYEDIDTTVPGPISPGLTAVVEMEVDGIWVVLGYQFELINSDENTPLRTIIVSPALQVNPGQDLVAGAQATAVRISRSQGVAANKMRVVIYSNDSTNLDAVTLSGHGRKYDTN